MDIILFFIGGVIIGVVSIKVQRTEGSFSCKIGLHKHVYYDVQSGYTRCSDCNKKLIYGRWSK